MAAVTAISNLDSGSAFTRDSIASSVRRSEAGLSSEDATCGELEPIRVVERVLKTARIAAILREVGTNPALEPRPRQSDEPGAIIDLLA